MAVDLEHGEGADRLRASVWEAESNLKAFKQNMARIATFKVLPQAERDDILTSLGMTQADVLARIAPLETILTTIQAMIFKSRYTF